MDDEESRKSENEICIHIFSVSAGMVGVCLTVIGIFRAVGELKKFDTIGDNILAADALIFLASCIISYFALRTADRDRKLKIEKIADLLFLSGLTLMAIVCVIIVYVLI